MLIYKVVWDIYRNHGGLMYILDEILLSVKKIQISEYLTKIRFKIFWKDKNFKISGGIRTHEKVSKPLRGTAMF